MGKSELDDFNEREVSISKKENTSITWEDTDEKQEAVCAVCDALFTATLNRPPIFCPACKAALNYLIDK